MTKIQKRYVGSYWQKKKKNGRCLRGEPTSFSEGPCFGGSIDTSVECEIGGTH